jgi:hypothetical protein
MASSPDLFFGNRYEITAGIPREEIEKEMDKQI